MNTSIVIASYNSGTALRACLLALNHQVLKAGDSFDVLVVNDGSSDDTAEVVASTSTAYPRQYFFIERTADSCVSKARNHGASHATGDVIIFLDPDQIVTPDFVASHIRRHELGGTIAVIGMRTRLKTGEVDVGLLGERFDLRALPPIAALDVRFRAVSRYSENAGDYSGAWHLFFSCNVSVPTWAFRQVGGFDGAFTGWGLEDCELGYKLDALGIPLVFLLDEISFDVWHPRPFDRARYERWLANLEYFKTKHPSERVGCQEAFGRSLNPDIVRRPWVESYSSFEDSLRQLEQRTPPSNGMVVIKLQREWERADVESICEDFAGKSVVVLDYCGAPSTSVHVQLAARQRNLRYFAVTKTYSASYEPLKAGLEMVEQLRSRHAELLELSDI